jgi:D-tyrosyl-tRNA(Tyr) deacylase
VRAVLQRVSSASVTVGDRLVARIAHGLLVLVGVERGDSAEDVAYVAGKIHALRLFADDDDKMNRSVVDVQGGVLLVSQFTLCGDTRKGRRPSFDAAALPDQARRLYDDLVLAVRAAGLEVATGEFQAMMAVSLVNDGPVTVLVDSRRRF